MEIYPLFPNEISMEIQLLVPKRFILLPFPLIILLVQIETTFKATDLDSTVLTKPQLFFICD